MQLSPTEISDLIKKRIEGSDLSAEAKTQGTIVAVTDGIVRIHGLSDVMAGEMIEFPNNTFGLALNLERDSVGAVILGDYQHLSEGDTAKCTGKILEVPVGESLIGRVVNSLGAPIDGKGEIDAKEFSPIEKIAPRSYSKTISRSACSNRTEVNRRNGANWQRAKRVNYW